MPDSSSSQNTSETAPSRRRSQRAARTTDVDTALTRETAGENPLQRKLEIRLQQIGLPKLVMPDVEQDPSLEIPRRLSDISGRKLSEKLQEVTAWHAYALEQCGILTSEYILWAVTKRNNPRDEEIAEETALASAAMKRMELYCEALERLYTGLSRQVAARDIRNKIEGSRHNI